MTANKQIWKFPLEVEDKQSISLPEDAEVLSVQIQHGKPCLWALVIPDSPTKSRVIEIFGTGTQIPEGNRTYIGTVQMGPFVWHVFDVFAKNAAPLVSGKKGTRCEK